MEPSDTVLLAHWVLHRDAEAMAQIVARHSRMEYAACTRDHAPNACEEREACGNTAVHGAR